MQGLDLRPPDYKSGALPAELMRRDLPTYQPWLENPGVLVSGEEPLVTPCVGRVPVAGFEPARLWGACSIVLSPRAWCGIGLLLFGFYLVVFLAPVFPHLLIIMICYAI